MASVVSAIKNVVPISQFNKGQAGKIFDDVRNTGAKVVMKNNVAECVLMSPDEYVKLMDEINDARLILLAEQRIANKRAGKNIAISDVMKSLGITQEDLDNAEDVDIE